MSHNIYNMIGEKSKFGIFKGLVDLFDTKRQATLTAILVLALAYVVYQRDRDKDKMYGIVIEEVRKQVKPEVQKQVDTLKRTADSTKVIAQNSATRIDTAVNAVMKLVDKADKKFK